MRSRSKKLLLIIVLVLPVAGYAVYLLVRTPDESAEVLAAKQALEQRDFTKATFYLEMHLKEHPDDLPVRLLAAQTCRRDRANFKAMEHLRLFEKKGGSKQSIALERQLTSAQEGDLREAKALLDVWIERPDAPETPLVLEAAIQGSLNVIFPEHALQFVVPVNDDVPSGASLVRAAELWLRLRPARADRNQGYLWCGRANSIAENHVQAVAAFRKALELDPGDVQARMLLALTISQELPDESIAHLRILYQRDRNDEQIGFQLATALHSQGHLNEAKAILLDLLPRKPDANQMLIELGYIALDLRDLEEAERWLRKAYALDPNLAETNLALARCLSASKRAAEAQSYQEAFDRLDKAANLKKSGPPAKK